MQRCALPSKRRLNSLAFVPLVLLTLMGNPMTAGHVLDTLDTAAPQPTPTPTPDRLAAPVMPESPTQCDIGRNLYYLHCMPCHGDRGQGLTDEWREVWVEDHQNCWARGCHRGRPDDEGFFIPRHVPPVSGSPQALKLFPTAEDLFVFLRHTQPPQHPGALSDAEYWALTAFLLHENDRLSPGVQIGPDAAGRPEPRGDAVVAATLGLLSAMLLGLWAAKQWKRQVYEHGSSNSRG
jgi:hypothetical protein